jgi:hypothetical protein
MGKSFFEAIVHGYEKCEKLEIMRNKFYRIDARRSQDEISQTILEILNI